MSAVNWWRLATVLLAVCCVLLAYRVIDQAITLSYSDAGHETSGRHIRLLKGLIEKEWLGLSEAQVEAKLKAFVVSQPPDSILMKRERDEKNAIYLEGFRFEFRDGKLVQVT